MSPEAGERPPPENAELTAILRDGTQRDAGEVTEGLMRALRSSLLIAPVSGSGDGPNARLDLLGTTDDEGADALLAFSDAGALSLWSSEHAFVAVRAPDLCVTVLDRGLQALHIDVAGPVPLTLGPEALRRCAREETA